MDQLDAYRCAKILLDQHGADAAVVASMRADELQASDEAGRRAWVAIIAAIDELSRVTRAASERLQ